MNIKEYILLSKEERQAHLDLNSACIETGSQYKRKRELAAFLNTTVPTGRILLCHACNNHACSNLKHLYFGTDRENIVEDGEKFGTFKNVFERSVEKHGIEQISQMRSDRMQGNKHGEGNKGSVKTEEHKHNISLASKEHWVKRKELGLQNGGRPTVMPPEEVISIVKEKGFKDAAASLSISVQALKGRYYRAVESKKD